MNFTDQSGGRASFDERDDANSGADGGEHGAFVWIECFGPVVPAFAVDVWLDGSEKPVGARLVKDDHDVHATQGRKDGGAMLMGLDGATGRFVEHADGSVAVKPHDKRVAEAPGLLKIADMAVVQ